MESFIEEQYIEKITSFEDALAKLNELIEISGEKIEYDYETSIATITTKDNQKRFMKRLCDDNRKCFEFVKGNKTVGLYFSEFTTAMHYGVNMHVLVKEGQNIRIYEFHQGDKSLCSDFPVFSYYDYQDGIIHCFSSDGHLLELATSNNEMLVFKNILRIYGIEDPTPCQRKINYKELDFGAYQHHVGYNQDGSRKYNYVPKVELEYIKNNNCITRKLHTDSFGALVYESTSTIAKDKHCPTNCRFPNRSDRSEKIIYRNPNGPENFALDDISCLNYSVEVLQSKEGLDAYREWKSFFENQPIMAFINKYYGRLICGIEYYQSFVGKENTTEPLKIIDARICTRSFNSSSKVQQIAAKAKRLLSAK